MKWALVLAPAHFQVVSLVHLRGPRVRIQDFLSDFGS